MSSTLSSTPNSKRRVKTARTENSVAFPTVPEGVIEHHLQVLSRPMEEWFTSKRFPPVLLLSGLPGTGKRAFAYTLAQWILCEQTSFSRHPCQLCPSCQRILAGNSVDLIEITASPASSEDTTSQKSQSLKTDQFRELRASTGFSGAVSSGHHQKKVILIPDANRMTPQAANSILKLLEEPPAGWIFILTTHDPSVLLPTLLSRCQKIRLHPFSSDQIEDFLAEEGIAQERQKICSQLSQGSWARARTLAKDETWEKRKAIFEFLDEPSRVIQALVEWASQDSVHLDLLLDLLEQMLADLIRWSSQTQVDAEHFAWIQEDGKASLVSHIRKLIRKRGSLASARNFWLSRAERIARMRQEALAPLNKKLLIQDLLIPWLETAS